MRLMALLLVAFLTAVSPMASSAEKKVIIDRITESEAEDLDIEIPDSVPPGFHNITIEVYDDNGTVSEKMIEFCKDEEGIVQWDNNCPNLVFEEEVEEDQSYDPLQDKERTKGIHLALFALLAAITATRRNETPRNYEKEDEEESWQSVSSGSLKIVREDVGWGDRSRTWRTPFTSKTDALSMGVISRVQRKVPLVARIVQDGDTLRAMFGSWAMLLTFFAVPLGVLAGFTTQFEALPPIWFVLLGIIVISVFDATAGFVAGALFFLPILLSGNVTNRPEWLTALGVLVICFAPALLASAFRPMRRHINNDDDRWERITDYAIATLLTYWAVKKMVEAMDGLARLDLTITDYAHQIGLVTAGALLIRILLEDVAIRHYPARLKEIYVQIEERTVAQQLRFAVFRVLCFVLMTAPFAGTPLNLLLGTIIFAIPQFTTIRFEDRIPQFNLYFPRGLMKTIVMIFVMVFVSRFIEGLFEKTEDFLRWNFVVMALPGFVFHYLYAMDKGANTEWRQSQYGRWVYRIGGVVIFALMVQVVRGVDIAAWLK